MNGNPIEPPSGSEDFSHAFHVPDDARELDRDVEAWRREERWARRRQRLSFASASNSGASVRGRPFSHQRPAIALTLRK